MGVAVIYDAITNVAELLSFCFASAVTGRAKEVLKGPRRPFSTLRRAPKSDQPCPIKHFILRESELHHLPVLLLSKPWHSDT